MGSVKIGARTTCRRRDDEAPSFFAGFASQLRITSLFRECISLARATQTMTKPPRMSPNPRPIPLLIASVFLVGLAPNAYAEPSRTPPERPSKANWSYMANLGFSNDNLPGPQWFAPADRLDPRSAAYADDDGRTFGLVFEHALTNERRGLQFVVSSWYEMLTQDGAQEDVSRDRRADVLNNIVQVNQRFDLGSGFSAFVGMGVGVQTVGDLGGIRLQSWWHREGGFGGRLLDEGLQNDYGDMRGSVTVPAMSPGVRLGKRFGREDGWNARAALGFSALVAMGGSGLSFALVDLNARAGHPNVADVWAGVFLSGGNTNDDYLRFAPIGHGALGYEIGLALHPLHNLHVPVSPYITIQSNGSGLADTTFTVGFLICRGAWPWLRPPR